MSKGFGHLKIRKNWIVRGDATVHVSDKRIDSQECWEDYDDWE